MKRFIKNLHASIFQQKVYAIFSLCAIMLISTSESAFAQIHGMSFTWEWIGLTLLSHYCSISPASKSLGPDISFTIMILGLLSFATFRRFRKK